MDWGLIYTNEGVVSFFCGKEAEPKRQNSQFTGLSTFQPSSEMWIRHKNKIQIQGSSINFIKKTDSFTLCDYSAIVDKIFHHKTQNIDWEFE